MGNAAATLHIRLDDKVYCQAGTTVQGRVSVDLASVDTSSTRGGVYQLLLYVTGKEKVILRSVAAVRSGGSHAQRKFLSTDVLLHEFCSDQVIMPGWHDFPFSFPLPATMPSSMRCDFGTTSYCTIEYKLKAVLCSSLGLGASLSSIRRASSLQVHREFTVQAQPSAAELVPFSMQPKTIAVRSFGLVSKGTVSFGVRLEDTHVSKGEQLQISVAARNDSEVDLECVQIKLMERVTCSTTALSGEVDDAKNVKTTSTVLAHHDLKDLAESMQSRETIWYTKNISGLDHLKVENEREIYLDLQSKKHSCQLQIPTATLDSYKGLLLRVEHFLKIKVKTSAMVDDPVVLVPLMLLNYNNVNVAHALARRAVRLSDIDEDDDVVAVADCSGGETGGGSSSEASDILYEPTKQDTINSLPRRSIPQLLQTGDGEYRLPLTTRMAPRVEIPIAGIRSGGILIMQESLSVNGGSGTSLDASFSSAQQFGCDNVVVDEEALPSLSNLLKQMHASMNDFEIIQERMEEDNEWQTILLNVTPEEFGSIVAHVNIDIDQPKVAAYLAAQIASSTGKFTCQHCKEAVDCTAEWNRVTLVQRLLPFCADLEQQQFVITQELTPWELTLTADDFIMAMQSLT